MCGVPHRLLFRIKLWVNSRGEHLRFGGRRRRRRRKRGWGERENFGDWILLLLPPPQAQTLFPPSPSHLDPPCFSVAFSQNDHASSSSPSQEKLFLAPRLSSPFPPLSPLHFSSNASPYSYRSLGRRRRGEKLFGTSSRDFAACEYHSFFKRFPPFFFRATLGPLTTSRGSTPAVG